MNIKKTVTVFTPTYNRQNTLPRLYNSLCKQDCKDFIWLVVDDGSTDQTGTLIHNYIKEGIIDIKYKYKENGGKMAAHNDAVLLCNTELFFCLDSDDWLTANAIVEITDLWESIRKKNYAGFIGHRITPDGLVLGGTFPISDVSCTFFRLVYEYKWFGDTSIIYRTEVLRKYLYPIIQNEKFIPDAYIYFQIDNALEMYISNKTFTICEYQSGGYTAMGTVISLRNPIGYSLYKREIMLHANNSHEKVKALISYIAYSLLGGKLMQTIEDVGCARCILLLPISFLYIMRLKLMAAKQVAQQKDQL